MDSQETTEKGLRSDESKAPRTTLSTACIVIPTYNEAANIANLLDRIFENVRQQRIYAPWHLSVLVVDDSSPDGTADVVRTYQAGNQAVHLLVRKEKEGLGAAYIAGMSHALAILQPDVIMEMDADFSHNPDDILRLLAAIREGADFVIGSRYTKGGSIPREWGIHRRIISKAANIYTKAVLRIPRVKDCSGGFRAIRSPLLRQVNLSSLNVKGYAFQVLLLEAAIRGGATVREVPIAFLERNAGKSKMRITDMAEGGALLLRVGTQRLFFSQRVPSMSAAAGASGGIGTMSATAEEQPIKVQIET